MEKNVYSYLQEIFEYLENVESVSTVVGHHSLLIDGEATYFTCKTLVCDRPTHEDFLILVFNKYLEVTIQIILDYQYILEDSEYHNLDLMVICLSCNSSDSDFRQWKKDCRIRNSCGNCCISWELPTPEEITIPLEILTR